MSRSTVFEFKPLTPDEILPIVTRAFSFVEQEGMEPLELEEGVAEPIAASGGGDVRKAINAVELLTLCLLYTSTPRRGRRRPPR